MGKCLMSQVFVIGGDDWPASVDGESILCVRLTTATGLTVDLTYNQPTSGTILIDWGNGTSNTYTDIGVRTRQCTYASEGDYTIRVKIISGATKYKFGNQSQYCISPSHSLRYVYIGKDYDTEIERYSFQNCKGLMAVVFDHALNMPAGLDSSCFSGCSNLRELILPPLMGTLWSSCLNYVSSLTTLVLLSQTQRNLSSSSAISGFPDTLKIYVPDDLVATYKSATNWSTYADYIYPISEKGVTHND